MTDTLNGYTSKFTEGRHTIYAPDGGVYCKLDWAGIDRAQEVLNVLNATLRPSEIRLTNQGPASPVGEEAKPVTGPTDGSTRQADVSSGTLPMRESGCVWQPIETAPKDDTLIVALTKDNNIRLLSFGDDYDKAGMPLEKYCWRYESGAEYAMQEAITHWLPVPENPPVIEVGEGK